ncbi:hypothetical protein B0I35DRAFT_420358 [Stachybotrys elegans]|uniref:F-box domain-containing protein n=1 Tax=Stachybotrys elegans TaxID=80388 RepID=A0A8K0WZ38_9HYPO|nr:hypothetical protein B0I35DRAFT_420358 [Stachybotrys elegans]
MAFNRLPTEVWQEIGLYLASDELCSLTFACRRTMAVFQRGIYQRLIMREDARSGARVLAIAKGPRRDLVECLEYLPRDPYTHHKWDSDFPTIFRKPSRGRPIRLSPESRAVLSGLAMFPHLKTLILAFDNWWTELPPLDLKEYVGPDPSKNRSLRPCNILLRESLVAVGEASPCIERLVWRQGPSWTKPTRDAWEGLKPIVDSAQALIIEVPFRERGNGWDATSHSDFISDMGRFLLRDTERLEHLRVVGHLTPLPRHGRSRKPWLDPMLWGWRSAPCLRRLEVTFTCVDECLTSFITQHIHSLEHVLLGHCFGANPYSWWRLVDGIVRREPRRLVEFRILTQAVCREGWTGVESFLPVEWDQYTDELVEPRRDVAFVDEMLSPRAEPSEAKPSDFETSHILPVLDPPYGNGWEMVEGVSEEEINEYGGRLFALVLRQWQRLQALIQMNREASGLGRGLPAMMY